MLVVGDRLFFYYSGLSGEAPNGPDMYAGGSTGVAFLRRDGFASMDAGSAGGKLITRKVRFSGAHLFVNFAAAGGEMRTEVLDEKGQVLPGFAQADCTPLKEDSTLAAVTWRGGADLAALRGKPVRFRFHLTRGSLYAFWVSPDASGASRGYLAAGGPGYDGPVDTVGQAALRPALR